LNSRWANAEVEDSAVCQAGRRARTANPGAKIAGKL
jgi:hypothetical protein